MSKLRINEVQSLFENDEYINLIQSRNFGDVYYNICEQGDERMSGFKKVTGYIPQTILLATDKTILPPVFFRRICL